MNKIKAIRGVSFTLAIDIHPSFLSFVKVSNTGEQLVVEDYKYSPLAEGPFPLDSESSESIFNHNKFKQILGKELASFCTQPEQCDIWCSLPREFVEVHSLSIPPVPASEIVNAIYWATRKQIPVDEEKIIMDFILLDEGKPVKKRPAIVFLAPRLMVMAYKKLFAELGYPLTGLTSPSIGFQNQIKREWLQVPDSFALLHVEEQNSYIDLYHKGMWIFGREIKTGLKSFVDSFIEEEEARSGTTIDDHAAKRILFDGRIEGSSVSNSAADDILRIETDETSFSGFVLPAAERLVRQLERTFDYCVSTFGTPRATGIYISGQPAASGLFIESISAESGLECLPADPYNVSAKKFGNVILPKEPRQRCVMNTAFGLAFSRRFETQNFLNTYQKRVTNLQTIKINKIIWAGFAAIAVIISTLFAFQHNKINKLDAQLALMERQFATASSLGGEKINERRLVALSQKVLTERVARNAMARKNNQIGLIGEITRLIPERIQLVRLSIAPVAESKSKGFAKDTKQAIIEGVVFGVEQSREFVMTGFFQQLADSPLVKDARFLKKHITTIGDKKVLYFTAAVTPKPISFGTTKDSGLQRVM